MLTLLSGATSSVKHQEELISEYGGGSLATLSGRLKPSIPEFKQEGFFIFNTENRDSAIKVKLEETGFKNVKVIDDSNFPAIDQWLNSKKVTERNTELFNYALEDTKGEIPKPLSHWERLKARF